MPSDNTDAAPPDLAIVGATALVGTPTIGVDGPAVFSAATTIEVTDGAITWIGPSTDARRSARLVRKRRKVHNAALTLGRQVL